MVIWDGCQHVKIMHLDRPAQCAGQKLREMALPRKIREISGNLPSSSSNFWKQRNLREFSWNGHDRFKCCLCECDVVFHMCSPQFPGKNRKNKPLTNSPRVDICNIYLPMVNWWMACLYHNNGVHFHLMKILMCYVMDLKLIDVINVSYMYYTLYLLQILLAFSK